MRAALETATEVVRGYKAVQIPDGILPDVIADLRAAEETLAEYRKALVAEAPGPTVGQDFELKERRRAKRSYNPSRILAAFAQEGESIGDTIRRLDREGVVTLSWSWSRLRQAADRHDVSLDIAQHEIEDGDEAMVGEVWQSYLATERRKE